MKVVWNNVRKIRTKEKQMELDDWMQKNDCDVCAINETGLMGVNMLKYVTGTHGLEQIEIG